jgi:hypothetical protein
MTVAFVVMKVASVTSTLNDVTETGNVQTAKTNGNATKKMTSSFTDKGSINLFGKIKLEFI